MDFDTSVPASGRWRIPARKKSHTATIRDGQMALFNRLVKYEGTAKVIDVGHESYESFFRIGFVGAAAFVKGEIGIPRELHVELQLVTANLSRFTVINPVSLLNTVAGNRDRLDAFLWPDLLREFALTEKEARHVDYAIHDRYRHGVLLRSWGDGRGIQRGKCSPVIRGLRVLPLRTQGRYFFR